MDRGRRFVVITVGFGLVALAHAAVTWPAEAVVALFGGGAIVAFVGEMIVIRLGWLDHHTGRKLFDVPLFALFGWTGTVYVAVRLALLVTAGWTVIPMAAAIATGYDVLTDHRRVEEGFWTYTDDLPGPRHRGVPWWNYAGWLAISALTAAFAVAFL